MDRIEKPVRVVEPSHDGATPAVLRIFAYGSNMLSRRLHCVAPSATSIGIGQLNGHVLRWHKRSRKDHSGKCDLLATGIASNVVHGVVFELPAVEKARLDRDEGLGRGYDERSLAILVDGMPVMAGAYVATLIDPSLRPYHWYKALVVAGAREHRLPDEYIRALEATVSTDDPDQARAAKRMALLSAG